jgi:hypothetical protein
MLESANTGCLNVNSGLDSNVDNYDYSVLFDGCEWIVCSIASFLPLLCDVSWKLTEQEGVGGIFPLTLCRSAFSVIMAA